MAYENFRIETGTDGIAVVTWDMPGRSMNVFTAKVMDELAAIVEAVARTRPSRARSSSPARRTFPAAPTSP